MATNELIEKAKAFYECKYPKRNSNGWFATALLAPNALYPLMAEFAESYAAEVLKAERGRWQKENKLLSDLLCGEQK